jgi:hypothetical protein
MAAELDTAFGFSLDRLTEDFDLGSARVHRPTVKHSHTASTLTLLVAALTLSAASAVGGKPGAERTKRTTKSSEIGQMQTEQRRARFCRTGSPCSSRLRFRNTRCKPGSDVKPAQPSYGSTWTKRAE